MKVKGIDVKVGQIWKCRSTGSFIMTDDVEIVFMRGNNVVGYIEMFDRIVLLEDDDFLELVKDVDCDILLEEALNDYGKCGGRMVFWTCPNGCRDVVDWCRCDGKLLATCRKCGLSKSVG